MRSYIAICCFLLCCFAAKGQFSDSIKHHVLFSTDGNINRTNNGNSFLLNNNARFSIKNKRTAINTNAGWLYGRQNSTLVNNDFLATLDVNHFIDSSKFYYWGLGNFTSSYSLKIKTQLQTGAGAAYNFVNTDKAWLNLSDGIIFETSSLSTGNGDSNSYRTTRNSLRVSYRFAMGRIVALNGVNFIQNSFRNGNDYIIRSINSIDCKLNRWISFSTSLSYNQFTRTKTETLLFTYGLKAEKYF